MIVKIEAAGGNQAAIESTAVEAAATSNISFVSSTIVNVLLSTSLGVYQGTPAS
jgi:hypothetical protein